MKPSACRSLAEVESHEGTLFVLVNAGVPDLGLSIRLANVIGRGFLQCRVRLQVTPRIHGSKNPNLTTDSNGPSIQS